MPSKMQIAKLVALSLGFWALATLYIRLLPNALINPLQGSMGFVTTLPVAWLSVWLTKVLARLAPNQLLSGVAFVGATAMMIDGVALRWFSDLYGSDPLAVRLGAAWLLWGYGVSMAVALTMVLRSEFRAR
ncbi:DUF5367 family protein [Caulobacter sp. BK020]|uniref:DUF5367 family protein n=1 Tax=Caulobacter sp. BK020 TaxID=2512117 RepID=UPI0010DCA623|nr:DUF5367 family protein [Caulobacter sp. BK020]TCS12855.1 hypothetical protein EV278_11150 [Caulobacter sp. BK020]